jgi:hypothetical protein
MVRRSIFADMSSDEKIGVPDGMKVDVQGNVVMDGGSALPSGTAPGRCNPDQRAPRPALAREDRPLRYPAQALSPADPCNKVGSGRTPVGDGHSPTLR